VNLASIIDDIKDELIVFIKDMKMSYFSAEGKMGWQPLKPNTIKKKERQGNSYPEAFNLHTGELRDSCEVVINVDDKGLNIKVFFDGKDEKIVNYLTETLGRDFVTFDDDEKAKITEKVYQLITQRLR
jgi:hypothetical protein